MKKRQKILMLLVCFVFISAFSVPVLAAEKTVDFSKKGSISITLKDSSDENKIVKGSSFTLYKVGTITEKNNNLMFELTPDFMESGIMIDKLQTEGMEEELLLYAQKQSLVGTMANAKQNGTVEFNDLELGLYLVEQTGTISGYYSIKPFLVSIPMSNPEDTGWIYHIDASPKIQLAPDEPVDLCVKKVWEDGNSKSRPTSVSIQLLKDESNVVETIYLDEKNDWTYSWENLSPEHAWKIKETNVPKGYTVSYKNTENMVIITNTATLIQTGQLNWPVPVLSVMGIVLFVVGYTLNHTKRKRENET